MPANPETTGYAVISPRLASPAQVLSIVCVGIVLANLDLFIVNVAMPSMQSDFGETGLQNMSWVLNGYAITYAALLIFFGRLAERYRRDLSFLLGVALFTVASVACAVAWDLLSLCLFRLVQAAGAALMTPTSLGLLLAANPPEKRASAVRAWTAIGGFGAALGPLVGGLLVDINWRWIFLVNVPFGLLAIFAGWRKLPMIEGHHTPIPSFMAAVLITASVAMMTLAIVNGNDWGWGSLQVVGCFITSLAMLALFSVHCYRSPNPFIDPSLFRIRPFTGAALVMAPYSVAFGAMLLSIALWQQTVWGWSAMKTGLTIAPGPLMVPTTALLVGGRLIARFGAAAVLTLGVLCFAGGLVLWVLLLGEEPSLVGVLVGMVLTGIGVGLTFPTLMAVATSSLPPSSFATGSGVVNMIRQTSLAVGVALYVAIVGLPNSLSERVAGFHRGWSVMVIVVLLGLIPNYVLIAKRKR